ncbi:hypothetical protein Hanom_Chr04g00371851 [Helianthus anomalus]
MGVRKDLFVSYSRLTEEEVEAFCQEWGIDSKFNLVAQGLDKSTDQSLPVRLHCIVGTLSFQICIIRFRPLF